MDKRKKYTRMFLHEALQELLKTKHLKEITVKELCEKADINRTTFSRNYQDIYELFEEEEKEMMEASFASQDMSQDRMNILKLIYDHQSFYREFFYNDLTSPYIENIIEEQAKRMQEILKKQGKYDERTFPILYQYNIDGAFGVMKKWLNEGCQMSPDELGAILYRIVEKQYR